MSLVKSGNLPQPSVYRRILGLKSKLSHGIMLSDLQSSSKVIIRAIFNGNKVSLCLWLQPMGRREYERLGELGTYFIEEYSGKDMRQNLLPLFSKLCIYSFLGVSHKDIVDVDTSKVEESLRSEISGARAYEPAFNNLCYAAHHFYLSQYHLKIKSRMMYHKRKSRVFTTKMLQQIGPGATESLMKSLVSQRIQIGLSKRVRINWLNLSYSSRLSNSCVIRCYCPRLEMKEEIKYMDADDDLRHFLSHQLLQCELTIDSHVNIVEDCIHVRLNIPNLKCKSLPLDSYKAIPKKLEKEKYVPVKISVTMGPGPGCKSSVHDFFPGSSSPNLSTSVTEEKDKESALQFQLGVTPSVGFGFKHSHKISSTRERKNWRSVRSIASTTEGTLNFTLYDNSIKEPVCDYKPCCNSHCKAFKALLHGAEPPFTPDGGINFEEDMCGPPMTWQLRSDENLKMGRWFVVVQIWMAYYPNKYDTDYMEIKSKKFSEWVEIPLVQATTRVRLARHTVAHST